MELTTWQMDDIVAILNRVDGGDLTPDNGQVWLGNGEIPVLTDDGNIGFIRHDEEDGWTFVVAPHESNVRSVS